MNWEISRILDNQVGDFSSILMEATEWLRRTGKEMWTSEQVSVDSLLMVCAPEEMFLGYIDGFPAATMILQEDDEIFWPDAPKGESLFLHKLSVRRRFAGTSLAVEMINWAKLKAKHDSKKFLRLDCAADREKLCRFYEAQGFEKVREQVMFGTWPTAFYERATAY